MKVQAKFKQRGISLIGLVFVAGVLAMTGVVAAQVFPTVLEFMAVEKAVQRSSAGQSVAEIRDIFEKATAIDDIKSITAKELEITKEGDKVVVSFSYQREIHLAGPGYLTLKYQGRSK
jgi:beta-lactam-binding protein with PASTA domain